MTFPNSVLALNTELYVNGAWTDITSYVYARDGIKIQRGRANEASSIEPATMSITLNNRSGRFSPRNPTSPYYGYIGRNTPIRQSVIGSSYLQINQDTGDTVTPTYLTTPDTAALDVSPNIDIRFYADLSSWRARMDLVSKWGASGQQSYGLYLKPDGALVFLRTTDGSTLASATSTVPVPVVRGRLAVRVTFEGNDGAGNRKYTFYTASSLSGPWTQLGDVNSIAGTSTIFNSTAPLVILDNVNEAFAATLIRGKVYGVQVYSGVAGTLVANADFTVLTHGATSFVDSTGKTWTVVGDLSISTRDIRFSGEVTSWPQSWDVSGNDIYTPITCAGILRRLGQGSAPIASTLRSAIPDVPSLLAYWPCEDAGGTQLYSAIAGAPPIVVLGDSALASDSSFACSLPIPTMNTASWVATVLPYTGTGTIQVRFLIHVPAAATDGAVILRLACSGTAARWDVVYKTTSGGSLQVLQYDAGDTTANYTSGVLGFNMDGEKRQAEFQAVQNGSNIDWQITTNTVDGSAGFAGASVSSRTVGIVNKMTFGATKNLGDIAIGHIYVQSVDTSIYDVTDQLDAYNGEVAGRRIQRLCQEQNVPIEGQGDLDDTVQMGPQVPNTLIALLQECVDVDMGILYEPQDRVGLGYTPRSALVGQAASLTVNYTSAYLDVFTPTEDDQLIRNDIIATRIDGSSARATDSTSTLSVNAPPLGVGPYQDALTLNVYADTQLGDQAGWRLRLGTIDEPRYPGLGFKLANPRVYVAISSSLRELEIGSRLIVTNPPTGLPPDDISQLIQGIQETLNGFEWSLVYNCSPSAPYDDVGYYYSISTPVARYTSDGSTVNTGFNTTATSISIATASGPLWTHVDGDYDVVIAGERMTVTNVTGSSSPQTFTVIRSVNGVVKSQSAGAKVELFAPTYYSL